MNGGPPHVCEIQPTDCLRHAPGRWRLPLVAARRVAAIGGGSGMSQPLQVLVVFGAVAVFALAAQLLPASRLQTGSMASATVAPSRTLTVPRGWGTAGSSGANARIPVPATGRNGSPGTVTGGRAGPLSGVPLPGHASTLASTVTSSTPSAVPGALAAGGTGHGLPGTELGGARAGPGQRQDGRADARRRPQRVDVCRTVLNITDSLLRYGSTSPSPPRP